MREVLDETEALESTTVGVYRTAATVKGGRRFSFAALVVVGNRCGLVGVGYGKANQVPPAIEKAQKEARRKMRTFPLQGRTIPHAVTGTFGACRVRLLPASPGTGVIAGAAIRAPLEMLGVQDCLTKAYGSRNSKNLVKAVLDGLEQLRAKGMVESLRGVEIEKTIVEEALERGQEFQTSERPQMQPAQPRQAPGRGGPGRGGGPGRSGGPGRGEGRGRGPGRGGPGRGGGRRRGGGRSGAAEGPAQAPSAPAQADAPAPAESSGEKKVDSAEQSKSP